MRKFSKILKVFLRFKKEELWDTGFIKELFVFIFIIIPLLIIGVLLAYIIGGFAPIILIDYFCNTKVIMERVPEFIEKAAVGWFLYEFFGGLFILAVIKLKRFLYGNWKKALAYVEKEAEVEV